MKKVFSSAACYAIATSLTADAQQTIPVAEEERGRNLKKRSKSHQSNLDASARRLSSKSGSKSPPKPPKPPKSPKKPSTKERLDALEACNDELKMEVVNLKAADIVLGSDLDELEVIVGN